MKFATPLLLFLAVISFPEPSSASEAATDRGAAVATLQAGLEADPEQAVLFFQDALQTNPASRRELFITALESLDLDPEILARLLYVARLEFPDEETLFAEAALLTLPDRAMDIRAAFLATDDEMTAVLSGPPVAEATMRLPSSESQKLDEEIRDAMARVAAVTEGKSWPEQSVSRESLQFKKPDEVRIPRSSRRAEEASLANNLPIDRQDEREIAPGVLKIDDAWKPSADLRLDESKFSSAAREGAIAPSDAKTREMAPSGSVGMPVRFRLPRSSVYYIPPAAGFYESTIDQESGETPPPALVIRPVSASPTSPK